MNCPNCSNSKGHIHKWDDLLECKKCGAHFYGQIEPETEEVPAEPKSDASIAAEYLASHPELLLPKEPTNDAEAIPLTIKPVKKPIGKPAVKKVAE